MTEHGEMAIAKPVPLLDEQGAVVGTAAFDPTTGALRLNVTDGKVAQKIKNGAKPTVSYTALKQGELISQMSVHFLDRR